MLVKTELKVVVWADAEVVAHCPQSLRDALSQLDQFDGHVDSLDKQEFWDADDIKEVIDGESLSLDPEDFHEDEGHDCLTF